MSIEKMTLEEIRAKREELGRKKNFALGFALACALASLIVAAIFGG
jgi:hypothetical protein